jgi:uncharacterized RDD family membrane protein YckC
LSTFPPLVTANSISASDVLPRSRAIGALWRRVLAVAIDGIIIACAEFAITVPFFERLSRLGLWGPLVGFWLVFPYFAVMDSGLGKGQTVGKRLMRIQVIGRDGAPVSFWRSVIRYTVFAIPILVDAMLLPNTRTPWAISTLISVIVFGLGGTTLYLVLFNRRTRQGLHDLAAGSYVAEANDNGSLKVQSIWEGHWVILGLLFLLFSLSIWSGRDNVARQGALYPEMFEDMRLVEGMEGVQSASVQDMTLNNSNDGKNKILVVNVYWIGKSIKSEADNKTWAASFGHQWDGGEAVADQVAKVVVEHDSTVQEHDLFKIVIIRGYNLGFGHAQVSYFYQHTPAEWNVRLFGTPTRSEVYAKQPIDRIAVEQLPPHSPSNEPT